MFFAMGAVVLFRVLISARFGTLLIGWRYFSSIKEGRHEKCTRITRDEDVRTSAGSFARVGTVAVDVADENTYRYRFVK